MVGVLLCFAVKRGSHHLPVRGSQICQLPRANPRQMCQDDPRALYYYSLPCLPSFSFGLSITISSCNCQGASLQLVLSITIPTQSMSRQQCQLNRQFVRPCLYCDASVFVCERYARDLQYIHMLVAQVMIWGSFIMHRKYTPQKYLVRFPHKHSYAYHMCISHVT